MKMRNRLQRLEDRAAAGGPVEPWIVCVEGADGRFYYRGASYENEENVRAAFPGRSIVFVERFDGRRKP
jgi:hypothetical protein